jgi:4-hydroxybenzoate polyprenyltransferase
VQWVCAKLRPISPSCGCPSTWLTTERTRWRPLAAGDVTQFQALTWLGVQLSIGLAILTQLNTYTIGLGVGSLALVTIYPYMKRITYYPQIVFGSTFMWAIFMGWSAAAGSVDWAMAAPLYVGGIAYGVMYDCIYAHQVGLAQFVMPS